MTDLKTFIEINRHFMTTAEMAGEAKVDKLKISSILRYYKWEAISMSDRIREHLQANPGAIVEDVAEKFDRSPQQVYAIARELGIKILSRRRDGKEKAEGEEFDAALLKINFPPSLIQLMREDGYGATFTPRENRIKEAYNQSGSPYGLADEIRGIKLK